MILEATPLGCCGRLGAAAGVIVFGVALVWVITEEVLEYEGICDGRHHFQLCFQLDGLLAHPPSLAHSSLRLSVGQSLPRAADLPSSVTLTGWLCCVVCRVVWVHRRPLATANAPRPQLIHPPEIHNTGDGWTYIMISGTLQFALLLWCLAAAAFVLERYGSKWHPCIPLSLNDRRVRVGPAPPPRRASFSRRRACRKTGMWMIGITRALMARGQA